MDDDGYVNIVGRIKDMVIRGGENIYPREIEEFLYAHPDIADVQVIGVPDAEVRRGADGLGRAARRRRRARPPTRSAAFCHGQLAHYKIPRYVHVVDEFPMTVTGKVRKVEMREETADGARPRGAAGLEVEPVEQAADAVAEAAEHVADALTERTDPLAQTVEATAEEHAHEHPVHRPEVAEVALGVGLVGPAALPVGHPPRADHHLADVGLRARAHPLGVELAGGDVAPRAAGRRVGHVDHGHPWRGSKKHGGRRVGSGRPSTRARTQAIA